MDGDRVVGAAKGRAELVAAAARVAAAVVRAEVRARAVAAG